MWSAQALTEESCWTWRAPVAAGPVSNWPTITRRTWGQCINGAPVGSLEAALALPAGSAGFVVVIGKPALRLKLCARIGERGHRLVNVIHPTAVVEPSAKLGVGVTIGAMAVVNSNACIGDAVLANTAAIVEHDAVIGDGVSLAPQSCVGERSVVGAEAFMCLGALILPRLKIGAGAVIGAGAAVYDGIPDRVLALRAPARPIRRLDESFDWAKLL